MRPPKPNSVEPPWYGTRMPGGVGGVASRGVPLSRSSTFSGHRRLTFSYFHWEGAGYPAAAFGLTTMINQAAIRARSWLFTPATRPDRFAKAAAAAADVVILDLEDAVAPKDKAEARATALDYLAGNPADGALHALRINGLNTQSGISDLDALLGSSAAPNFVVLPKTETAGHLQILDRLLTAAGPAEQSGTQKIGRASCRERV